MSTELSYRLLADSVLLLHLSFVVFVVLGLLLILWGGFRGWQWVRRPLWRWLHLAAIGIVVAQAWLGVICPLTTLEMALRRRAGTAVYDGSFIAHWAGELLFVSAPWWVFTACYTAFGALVAASWFWVRPSTQAKT